jgi:hypothetical protein
MRRSVPQMLAIVLAVPALAQDLPGISFDNNTLPLFW